MSHLYRQDHLYIRIVCSQCFCNLSASIAFLAASAGGRELNLIGLGRLTWKGDASPDFMERVNADRPQAICPIILDTCFMMFETSIS